MEIRWLYLQLFRKITKNCVQGHTRKFSAKHIQDSPIVKYILLFSIHFKNTFFVKTGVLYVFEKFNDVACYVLYLLIIKFDHFYITCLIQTQNVIKLQFEDNNKFENGNVNIICYPLMWHEIMKMRHDVRFKVFTKTLVRKENYKLENNKGDANMYVASPIPGFLKLPALLRRFHVGSDICFPIWKKTSEAFRKYL